MSDMQTFKPASPRRQHLNNQPQAHRLHRHGYGNSHAAWLRRQRRGKGGWAKNVSRQKPATCIRCQVLPVEEDRQKENNIIGRVQRQW